MKRDSAIRTMAISIFAAAVLLLTAGCASSSNQESAPAQEAQAAAAETTGISAILEEAEQSTAEPSQTPAAAVAEPKAPETPAPAPIPEEAEQPEVSKTPKPEETPAVSEEPVPTGPASLRELLPAGPTVLVDGSWADSVILNDVTFVQDTQLMKSLSWLTVSTDSGEAVYSGRNGEPMTIAWTAVTEENLSYSGSGGLCYMGSAGEEYWFPLRQLTEEQGLSILWDGDNYTAYVSTPIEKSLVPSSGSVPVLMYHEVGDDLWGLSSLFVSPSDMREQLQYLKDNGYETIFFSDLSHLQDYTKPVLLTFDDSYIGNYENLYPLLQEFGMKATIFTISGMLGDEHYMTEEQVREVSNSGLVDIQSHTVTHPYLSELSEADQIYELEQSRLDLARITGKVPYALAYPSGDRNSTTLAVTADYYAYGIIMNGGRWYLSGGGYYEITRDFVSRDTDIWSFAAILE